MKKPALFVPSGPSAAPDRRSGFLALIVGIAVVLSTGPLPSLAAQTGESLTRVGVAVLGSDSDQRARVAADSVYTTVDLVLRQLGQYEVSSLPLVNEATVAGAAGQLDYVVFGSVRAPVGPIEISLFVYSRAENRITNRHNSAVGSVFDLFSATEDAAAELVGGFSGRIIRFGSINLSNIGSPGAYQVQLDGVALADASDQIRALTGTRTVRIVQERMFRRLVVTEQVLTVTETAPVRLEFAVPLITADEGRALADSEEAILQAWDDPGLVASVERSFERLFSLLSDVSYSTDLIEYNDRYRDLHEQYRLRVAEGFSPADVPPDSGTDVSADPDVAAPARRRNALGLMVGADWGSFESGSWEEYVDLLPLPDPEQQPVVGLVVRAFYEREIWRFLSVGVGLSYEQRRGRRAGDGHDEVWTLNTIEQLLYVKPQLPIGEGSIYVFGGILTGFIVGDVSIDLRESSGIPTEDGYVVDSRFGGGVSIGAGFTVPINPVIVRLEARASSVWYEPIEGFDLLPVGFGVTAGVVFPF